MPPISSHDHAEAARYAGPRRLKWL